MFVALWLRWGNGESLPPTGKRLRATRPSSYRPGLEPLEARELPALPGGGLPPLVPAPAAGSGTQQAIIRPPTGTAPILVTVAENSPGTVIDLGPVFAARPGIQHGDGLQLAILGNTNSRLVTAELSEAALSLTYTGGQCGTATLTVAATDADGVSVQQTVVVLIRPPSPAGPVGATPIPVFPQLPALFGPWP